MLVFECCCWGGPTTKGNARDEDRAWGGNIDRCLDCGSEHWCCRCSFGLDCDASGHPLSDSQSQTAPYVPPTITYWATIESDGKEIHVPIADKHMSGPEKSIATGGMQKVWKWVHDKGLGDKVGLQDAFDLAQLMRKEEVTEEVKNERVQSRAGSVSSYRAGNRECDFWHID